MNKKVFTLLLLAVFMLAQFSVTSAAPIADVTVTIAALPTFSTTSSDLDLDYSLANMPGGGTQNVLLWYKDQSVDWNAVDCIDLPGNVNTLTAANGTYTFDLGLYTYIDQDAVEFLLTVVDAGSCGAALNLPAADTASQAGTFIDGVMPSFFWAKMPTLTGIGYTLTASCDTFELWAIGTDQLGLTSDKGYSGLKPWNKSITGTFAPPVAEGPAYDLLSWPVAFPHTATGVWDFSVGLEDYAGNDIGMYSLKNSTVDAGEVEECANFSDVAGHPYELYIRYLADIGLISGFADGTFGPDSTLTRAEASTLFEISNGFDPATLPTAAPSAACTFTDVSASDWFAGWVWQACDDGLMAGIGGGLFDPNNLLTRGQVVTIINNAAMNLVPVAFLPNPAPAYDSYLVSRNILNIWWNSNSGNPDSDWNRTAAWTDVAIGAYYAEAVVKAYRYGIADGTSENVFSPDQAVTRGEFAKMLYRAISRSY